jgi:hypothetical protein
MEQVLDSFAKIHNVQLECAAACRSTQMKTLPKRIGRNPIPSITPCKPFSMLSVGEKRGLAPSKLVFWKHWLLLQPGLWAEDLAR